MTPSAEGAGSGNEEVTMRGTAAKKGAGVVGGAAPGKADAQRLTGLFGPVVAAAGMDLESVRVTRAGNRLLVRVVVDSDNGVSLDEAADVSRAVSAELDAADAMGDVPYTLEVSSPGIDRPLTEPKHWRRAAGRLVKVPLLGGISGTGATGNGATGKKPGGEQLTGRVIAADGDGVRLEVDGQRRSFHYDELGAGSIQLEFARLESAQDTDSET
jgi:ribosome maturation factor RimP